ncbi:ADP-ribosyltransferase [Elizabethkingia occulta]|uniref:ADP-ribosyltransferase n=1 Tax=Elizabethkingia occulta TaxID=1867263 RepID=UPI0021A27F5D|nr:ADP-ribosyltransferase [Elizabethkingia occulta]
MSTLVLDQNVPVFPVKETPPELRQLTSRQIADTYYGGKAMDESKGYKIYTDDTALSGDIKEVTVYKSRHSKKIGNMDVVLFASKNGAFLLQRYMEALPQSNELILFIETDIGNLKNNVVRAKAGAGLTKPGSGEFAEILNFTREYQGMIPQEELRELINKGIYKNKTDIVNWLLSIKDTVVREFFNYFTKGILTEAEVFFKALSNDISKFKIEETGWNPNPKEGEYDPTFIPQILSDEIKKYYQHEAEGGAYTNLEGQKKVTAEIVERLFGKIDGIRANLTGPLSNAGKFLPDFVLKKFSQVFDWFFKQLDQLRKFLGDPVTGLLGIAYQGVQTANAFLCGIYNSLVDVIAGIFSLIEFIFKAVAAMQNIGENKIIYGEMLLELMEDFIEGVMSFDYVEFFKQSIAFQIYTIKGVINKATRLTLSQVAYYYGYITGIIIDIVVEALLTGGTATVAKLAKSVESFILSPLEKISQAIAKSVNFTKDVLTRAVEFFSLLIREFKKGVKNIFQKLEKLLNEIFGFGEDVADHALTPAERRVKERQKAKARRLAAKLGLISPELKILLKDKNFSEIYWDLSNGKVKRAFGNLLNYEEEAVLRFYTTNRGYKNFNKALRGEIKMTGFYSTQEKLMNEALEKLPVYESESLLYRIENLTDVQINEYYKVGKEITNKHFTSSSYDLFSIGEAMRKRKFTVLIRIESKNGKLIEAISTLKDEAEVIFKSNTTFYVDKFTENINPLDPFGSKIKTIIIKEK